MTQIKHVWRLNLSYRPLNLTPEAKYRYECLIKYKRLREKGFSESEALEFLNLKRSTFYSWLKKYKESCGTINMKTTGLENKSRRPHNFRISKIITTTLVSHVLSIRQENIMYGKEKIRKILEQDYQIFVSSSTIGRILKDLMNRNKIVNIHNIVKHKSTYIKTNRRIRYAERIRKQKPNNIGELVQIDHMVLNLYNGLKLKEFRIVDPTTRISISRIYSSANAINAREFLKEARNELEFDIKSIQVDGGSEFMGEFEEYCKKEGIKLYVLPPRSPKMNCYVERTNETYRYEFWNVYEIPDTIEETRKLLRKFEYDYNFKRPHQSLNYLTPMEYYNKMIEKVC